MALSKAIHSLGTSSVRAGASIEGDFSHLLPSMYPACCSSDLSAWVSNRTRSPRQLSSGPELGSESSRQSSLLTDTPPPTASAWSSSSDAGLFFQLHLASQPALLTSDQETQRHREPFIHKIFTHPMPGIQGPRSKQGRCMPVQRETTVSRDTDINTSLPNNSLIMQPEGSKSLFPLLCKQP